MTIPEIDGYEDGQWSEWTWTTIHVEGSHCREIVDNVVDMAHFFYVHFQMPEFFKNVFEGHVAGQHMRSYGRDDIKTGVQMDLPEAETISDAFYYGPSFMLDTLYTVADGTTIESKLINCHYPVTTNSFVLQFGTIVKKVEGMSDEQSAEMATLFTDGSRNSSSRTSRSGNTSRASRIRSSPRKTVRCISCVAGISSSTSTSRTSRPI